MGHPVKCAPSRPSLGRYTQVCTDLQGLHNPTVNQLKIVEEVIFDTLVELQGDS